MYYIFSLLFSISILNSFSSTLWQNIAAKNLSIYGERKIIPQQSTVLKLDNESFNILQLSIPTEESGRDIIMLLPTPDGTFKDFKVFERTCMEKELADKYPNIKTYQAICVENPSITAKLDYTSFGFHAMVFSNEGTYFIDPFTNVNTGYYNCYYKKKYTREAREYSVCETISPTTENNTTTVGNRLAESNDNDNNSIVPDGIRRTFRLALACTIEYSAAVGGPTPTKATVLSAIITSLNRINGVYEKELSIHMNLVAKEDTLIFITSDSYVNNSGGTMLGQNQIIIDNRIGNANYDIGHVFSTGGGGVAQLGVICVTGLKAQGVTGLTNPIGDSYDIDYVAHEMGHQFGGNHTFNAGTGSCSGNRNSSTAYEVGSGTTIMAYAGICNNNNPQPHSDDYFHRVSIQEIYTYISGTSCALLTNTSNTPPTVTSYIATYNIPYKTNFEVEASAIDPNGYPLSYCWEEYDLGPSGNWNAANNTTAPIFRSFLPNPSGVRVFPVWDSLIKNSIKYLGEVLPETTRNVKLRCTVRNIDADGYGAFNAPNTNLTIKSVITPTLFRVTSQATATTMAGNTNQLITWDVANTTASPISCPNVNIYLSLDSARTFPYILATNIANDGSQSILIPNVVTNNASARIKVKGSGNVFFDLNDGWIKIEQALISSFVPDDTAICEKSTLTFTNTSLGSPDSVRWIINGGSPFTSNSTTTFSSTFNTPGFYTVNLIAYKSGVASEFIRTIQVKPTPTFVFSPVAPIVCASDSINIIADYLLGATCVWSTGNSSQKITVKPLVNTYYSVVVTNDGCIATDSVLVKVIPTSTTNFSQTICDGEKVTIGSDIYTTTGNHTTVLQTTLGCDSTVNLILTVNPAKTTNISRAICEDESVMIGSSTFNTQGNHTVLLQTSLGCDSTVNLDLTIKPTPKIEFAPTTPITCAGKSIDITAEYIAGATCIWSTGSENTTITVSPTIDTYYSVTVTNNGCIAQDSIFVNVNTTPATPTITQSNDTLYSNVIIVGANYLWYKASILVSTATTPYYEFPSNGIYTLKIISNDCESILSASLNAALTTSIRTNKLDVQFAIIPNPNNGSFDIKVTAPKSGKYNVVLYNVAGQELVKDEMNIQLGVNIKRFNLNHIEKGIYFISLIGNDGISTHNIILQ